MRAGVYGRLTPMVETPFGPRVLFDAHTHFFDATFLAGVGKQLGLGGDDAAAEVAHGWAGRRRPDPVDTAQRWIAEMDRQGVDRMVSIHTLPGDLGKSAARGIASAAGRLMGYVMVNPLAAGAVGAGQARRHVARVPRRRALSRRCFASRCWPTRSTRSFRSPTSTRLNVFVHCGVLKVGFRTKLGLPDAHSMRPSRTRWRCNGPAAEFPRAKFIIPHLGSGLLRELLMLADQSPNVYSDTSGVGGWAKYLDGAPPPARVLRQAVEVMGRASAAVRQRLDLLPARVAAGCRSISR